MKVFVWTSGLNHGEHKQEVSWTSQAHTLNWLGAFNQ